MNEASEFQRRRNLPEVRVRYMPGRRSNTTSLYHIQKGEIGSKTEILSRGKIKSTNFFLPAFEG